MVVEKRRVARGGKNIIFRRGGGINIFFGPKYRPLCKGMVKVKIKKGKMKERWRESDGDCELGGVKKSKRGRGKELNWWLHLLHRIYGFIDWPVKITVESLWVESGLLRFSTCFRPGSSGDQQLSEVCHRLGPLPHRLWHAECSGAVGENNYCDVGIGNLYIEEDGEDVAYGPKHRLPCNFWKAKSYLWRFIFVP
jgi:hypothetical protein